MAWFTYHCVQLGCSQIILAMLQWCLGNFLKIETALRSSYLDGKFGNMMGTWGISLAKSSHFIIGVPIALPINRLVCVRVACGDISTRLCEYGVASCFTKCSGNVWLSANCLAVAYLWLEGRYSVFPQIWTLIFSIFSVLVDFWDVWIINWTIWKG